MAIAFVNSQSWQNGANNSSNTVSYTAGSGSNRLLVYAVVMAQTPPISVTVSSITYAGVNATFIGGINNSATGDNARRVELWYLLAPASLTNDSIVTLSTGPSNWDFALTEYSGVNQSAQPDASTTTTGDQALALTLTTVADNCWMVGVGDDDGGGTDWVAGANTTIRITANIDPSQGIFDTNGTQTPAGSHSMAVTTTGGASGRSIGVVASFAPVGAASPNWNITLV